jgi:hypothetical protein
MCALICLQTKVAGLLNYFGFYCCSFGLQKAPRPTDVCSKSDLLNCESHTNLTCSLMSPWHTTGLAQLHLDADGHQMTAAKRLTATLKASDRRSMSPPAPCPEPVISETQPHCLPLVLTMEKFKLYELQKNRVKSLCLQSPRQMICGWQDCGLGLFKSYSERFLS